MCIWDVGSRYCLIRLFSCVFLCSWLCWMPAGGTWALVTWEDGSLWPLAWGAWVELRQKLPSLPVVLVWLQRSAGIQAFFSSISTHCWARIEEVLYVNVMVWTGFLRRWTRLPLERDTSRAGWWRSQVVWITALNASGNRASGCFDMTRVFNVR